MATASSSLIPNAYEVRVWGMDLNDKPFIQSAVAQQFTESGVVPNAKRREATNGSSKRRSPRRCRYSTAQLTAARRRSCDTRPR